MEESATQTSLALQAELTPSSGNSRHRTKCDSAVDSLISYLRNLSQFWFTHFLLILLLVAYTFCGAYLFHYLEVDHHKQMVVSAGEIRNKIMSQLWNECRMNKSSTKSKWILAFKTKMSGYHTHLCFENIWMDETITNDTNWSYLRAVFYCGTIFTATGYGNIVTYTRTGRIITLIYGIIGIPYTLTVLLDIGSILTNGMRRAYIETYKLYYFGCFCWKGSVPSDLKFDSNITKQHVSASTSTYSSDFEEPQDKLFLLAGLKKSDFVIPIWVGCALIFAYTFLGAWIYYYYESWNYWEALYFIVVSLTTIGFGDFIPKHSSYVITFCYIMIGLAFVSLFFNLVVERISKALHKARKKFKRRLRKETKTRELTDEDNENGKMGRRSAITVRLVDTVKKVKKICSNPESSITPVVFLQISDSNLLKYVKFEKVKGNKQPGQAYISDKHFMKYLKEKMDIKQKVSF